MKVAVLGGKLQGVEATYLAHKAGWNVLLVDKNEHAPAADLADKFYCFDLLDEKKLKAVFDKVDFIIPALEKEQVLQFIYQFAQAMHKQMMFDPQSYHLSCSKIASDKLFQAIDIPAPKPWPHCQYPITVKPSGASGSEKVMKFYTPEEFAAFQKKIGDMSDWVIQEFLEGPSYSIEVVAHKGICRTFQVTELQMDEVYDCKRVIAPADLSREKMQAFAACAIKLAKELELDGIMDVEVILHNDALKVLEIDARLPSQTLTAVYQSSGIVAPAVYQAGFDGSREMEYTELTPVKAVVYEHIAVNAEKIKVCGEHIMGGHGRLKLIEDFFGADEALTDYTADKKEWVATLIITAPTRVLALEKEKKVIQQIMDSFQIDTYEDLVPQK